MFLFCARRVGPVVGSGPGYEEAMVFVLGLLLEPRRAPGDLHAVAVEVGDLGWRGDEPLDPDDELDEDGEAKEQGLVGGGQVDPGVEGHQEDELHEQGRVDHGVGQAGTQPVKQGTRVNLMHAFYKTI